MLYGLSSLAFTGPLLAFIERIVQNTLKFLDIMPGGGMLQL